MRWSQVTECGPVRRRNEDWLCACPGLGLFAVADGMGGHLAGDVASRMALEELEKYIRTHAGRGYAARDLLALGIQQANAAVYRSALENASRRGMGTTLAACLVEGYRLTVANVGDSRVLLLRGEKIQKLTNDHSLVQELLDGGVITEQDAFHHPGRNVLTKALGLAPRVEPDIFTYQLVAGDRLLICTDGLSGFVREQRIGQLMAAAEPHAAVRALLAEALRAGSNDNITMILMVMD